MSSYDVVYGVNAVLCGGIVIALGGQLPTSICKDGACCDSRRS